MNQHVTPVVEVRLYAMHHALNMGYQNIVVLQQNLTGLCNLVGTLEQKMHNLYQKGTAQLIKVSSNNAPRDDFEVHLFILRAELDGVHHIMEVGGFNTVVVDFKSFTGVTVWVQLNLPSDAPRFEHFIDLNISLVGIR